MSYCKKAGPNEKDLIIFATKEDHSTPSEVDLPPPEPQAGLILENGDINWNCPCLGGMATGPCGVEFRSAFSCFHYSENEPKGVECLEAFQTMQDCMKSYPTLYKQSDPDDDKFEASNEFGSNAESNEITNKAMGSNSTELSEVHPTAKTTFADPEDPVKEDTTRKIVIENPSK